MGCVERPWLRPMGRHCRSPAPARPPSRGIWHQPLPRFGLGLSNATVCSANLPAAAAAHKVMKLNIMLGFVQHSFQYLYLSVSEFNLLSSRSEYDLARNMME
jgi:hypothetical protein